MTRPALPIASIVTLAVVAFAAGTNPIAAAQSTRAAAPSDSAPAPAPAVRSPSSPELMPPPLPDPVPPPIPPESPPRDGRTPASTPSATQREQTLPAAQPQRTSAGLAEDPAIACYRRVRAAVSDGQGRAHTSTLFEQLALAAGIERAGLQPVPANCAAGCSAYDCSGDFFDAAGRSVQVPTYPSSAAPSDAEVRAWRSSVAAFYRGAYTDAKALRKLSDGKAALCTSWAEASIGRRPDPSVSQALMDLQQLGAEAQSEVDRVWLRNIVDAGAKHGCVAPAPLVAVNVSSWWVPAQYARIFLASYRDCAKPDPTGMGGCPHPFDRPGGPGNHVNARYITDVQSDACKCTLSWFVGDPTGEGAR
jgi:hypothetical protein